MSDFRHFLWNVFPLWNRVNFPSSDGSAVNGSQHTDINWEVNKSLIQNNRVDGSVDLSSKETRKTFLFYSTELFDVELTLSLPSTSSREMRKSIRNDELLKSHSRHTESVQHQHRPFRTDDRCCRIHWPKPWWDLISLLASIMFFSMYNFLFTLDAEFHLQNSKQPSPFAFCFPFCFYINGRHTYIHWMRDESWKVDVLLPFFPFIVLDKFPSQMPLMMSLSQRVSVFYTAIVTDINSHSWL